jgi:hypothetical protein
MKEEEYDVRVGGEIYTIKAQPGLSDEQATAIVTRHLAEESKHGGRRALAVGAGGILGGLAALPAAGGTAVLSAGLATPLAIGIEAGGVALGGATGGQIYDMATGRNRDQLQNLKNMAQDIVGGAASVPAGMGAVAGIQALGKVAAPYVGPVVREGSRRLADALSRGSKPAVNQVRTNAARQGEQVLFEAAEQGRVKTGEATIAQRRAEMLRENAARSRSAAEGFERKAAKATSRTQISPPKVGQVRPLSDRGAFVSNAAVAQRSRIYENQVSQDRVLREAADQVVADNETAGRFITDVPSAKELMKEVSGRLSPDPVKSPTATSLPSPEESKVLGAVQTAMRDRRVVLSEDEARAATDAGIKLEKVGDQYVRTFKTSFEALDNLRRRLGESFNGVPTGFEGIPTHLARDMYGKVSRVLDDYVGAARGEVQANWKAGLQALEPFDNTRTGKALTATQGETGISSVSSAEVPGRILSQGREGVQQLKSLSGEKTAKEFLQDEVETALVNADGTPLSYNEAVKKVGPNTKLGDAIKADPQIDATVQQHLQRLNDARIAGVRAENFAGFGKARVKKAETLEREAATTDTEAARLTKEAEKAKSEADSWSARLIELDRADPTEAIGSAKTIMREMRQSGRIDDDQYEKALSEIEKAATAVAKGEMRKNLITSALRTAGISALGGAIAASVLDKDNK